VVGPLLALALLALAGGDLRRVITLAVIPGAIGALLVLTVSDPRRTKSPGVTEPEGSPSGEMPAKQAPPLRWSLVPRRFRVYLGAWLPFSLVNSSDVFLILRAKQLGYSATAVVLIYALYNLVYALASVPLGHLSDRLKRRRVLVGGMVAFALVYTGFALATAPWHALVLFALYGLYIAATDGVGKAFVVDMVPAGLRATSIGFLGTVTGLATLAASTVAGVLWDAVGPWAPFAYGAAGALICAAFLALLPGLREPARS